MSEAISRETFDELKSYLGVYLQQGRPILDADWNESQELVTAHLRRLRAEALGDGSPNRGFRIDPVFPPPPSLLLEQVDTTGDTFEEALGKIIGACFADILSLALHMMFGPMLFFLQFPGDPLDGFESADDVSLSTTQGSIRVGRDRPAQGDGFLRLSGHPGLVTVTKTLDNVVDLSAYELATFKYRLNSQVPGPIGIFLEDVDGNRSEWQFSNPALAEDVWLPGFAAPLNLRFHILTRTLSLAVKDQDYSFELATVSGTTPMTWTLDAGALPAGLGVDASGPDDESKKGRISGKPTEDGTFAFTVKVTDAGGLVATQAYELEVKPTGKVPLPLPGGIEFLAQAATTSTTGGGADLTEIRKYGFKLYQDAATPLVWDLDDLRLGSSELEDGKGRNNFIIRGSEFASLFSQLTLMSILGEAEDDDGDGNGNGDDDDLEALRNLLDLINTQFQLSEPDVATAGRFYVGGLPLLQVDDVLYSDEADPNDPPLSPPPAGQVRTDAVYLDVWTEPVTYVEDPAIRDIALGGPDTGTRRRARHQVRVAQGGSVPTGDGIGDGTLATEGSYTAQANRLYRVEIDAPGDIDAATFRWSNDNASTILRVIEPVPPGSTRVVVEDASALHPDDLVLLRKDHGEERHQVASVFGNVVTLKAPTGAQLALLPAATRPGFTTFALSDRPALQRWNAFGQDVEPDPQDATISGAIDLEDGVRVRFGGRAMRRGDYWNFATRYLAGDEATGIDPVARIERLDFARARGVVHRYAPLATITRNGDSEEPDKIFVVADRRTRVANAGTTTATLPDLTGLTGTDSVHLGGMPLPPCGLDSKFVIFWSGDLFLDSVPADGKGVLRIRVSFYGEGTTDPATEPGKGHIQDRDVNVKLGRRPTGVDIPLQHLFAKSDTDFIFLPVTFVPTSVHVFAGLDVTGVTVQLTGMRLMALELKKGY